ncbi:MAG: hypothetical protein RTU92_02580 [Candidatus Thorarchaeota archaeon]
MAWYDSSLIKWVLPGALILSWSIRLWFSQDPLVLVETTVGLVVLFLLVTTYVRARGDTRLLWDESSAIMISLRPWTVEVSSAKLMTSVPIGIDLTKSASRVLRAMEARYDDENDGEVRFFVSRPLGRGSTLIGMQVMRRGLRLFNGISRADGLREQLTEDTLILEGAMKSAYPHMPIKTATLEDMLMVNSGGVESIATA